VRVIGIVRAIHVIGAISFVRANGFIPVCSTKGELDGHAATFVEKLIVSVVFVLIRRRKEDVNRAAQFGPKDVVPGLVDLRSLGQ
jgi:hypothetical protein